MSEPHDKLPRRLAELRSLLKLNQSELARQMGISPSLVSHWESGTRMPSQGQILALCRHLGVSPDYLLNTDAQPAFRFRAKATLTAAQNDAVRHALLDASQQTHFVQSILTLAQKPLEMFDVKADFSYPRLSSLATQFRETLKLNRRATLSELKQALAECGIHVFDWALPYRVSGMSYRGDVTVIFINSLHDRTRRLFTLAHEFAHVLFHLGRNSEDKTAVSIIASNRDPQEKEANTFASEFLIPSADIRAVAEVYGHRLEEPAMLEAVARSFHVSRDAIFYRLAKLDILPWETKSKYFTAHQEQPPPETRVEKLDEQVPANVLETALSLHFSDKVSAAKLAEWFFTTRAHVEEYLFGLSEDKDNTLAEAANGQDGDSDF